MSARALSARTRRLLPMTPPLSVRLSTFIDALGLDPAAVQNERGPLGVGLRQQRLTILRHGSPPPGYFERRACRMALRPPEPQRSGSHGARGEGAARCSFLPWQVCPTRWVLV